MKDLRAKLEKLQTEAEDCKLIGRLAADPNKRDLFKKLALDLRTIARDVQAMIAGQEVNHRIEENGRMAPKTSP